jgi:hypothetical protein
MKHIEDKKTFSLATSKMFLNQFDRWRRRACFAVAATMLIALHSAGQTSVLTQHNDNGRTGQNTAETILNTSNVNVSHFGKLFSLPVTGQVFAQPLYVPSVTIKGAVHNVLIAVTDQDNVYAFDADSPAAPLWTASLVDTNHGAGLDGVAESPMQTSVLSGCTDMVPYAGITSTPVIDPLAGPTGPSGPSGAIYVEAKSTDGTNYYHRLHALNLTSGAELPQGPALITATVSGTGDGSSGGQLTFDPLYQNNRPGLLLLNGSIYIGYASHCDYSPYHGWIFAYNESSFEQESVLVTTPNGGLGGFWMSGAGLAADESNYIFTASGNGDFDTVNVPATELGDTLMKLSTTGGNLSLQDYFTPSDQNCLANNDNDLGSGGVLVLPDQPGTYPHLVVAGGKEGAIYVVNRDVMTGGGAHYLSSYNCTTNDPQILEESASGAIGGMWSMPAYWNSTLYYWGAGDLLRAFPLVNGLPQLNNPVTNSISLNWPGATPSISSNGTTAGTGILWAVDTSQNGTNGASTGPAVLHAINAADINKNLWDSTLAAGNRDMAGNAMKFTVPTVVNGKVYIGTSTEVDVYGLFSPAVLTSPAPGRTLPGSSATFGWAPANGATSYTLWLGTSGVGSNNLWGSGTTMATSVTFGELPTSGATIYARLWTNFGGVSMHTDSTYTAAPTPPSPAALTLPGQGSTLAGPSATFQWTTATTATGYDLWLGTAGVGSNNLWSTGTTTSTSVTFGAMPTSGATIYARLWTDFGGVSMHTDSTFNAAAQAVLTSPSSGSTFAGPSATFQWTPVSGANSYTLWLGTTGVGSNNLWGSGATTVNSITFGALPTNGKTIYARLFTALNGGSVHADYTFTAASQAFMTSPAQGFTFTGPSTTFQWTNASEPATYDIWMGSTGVGSNNLWSSGSTTATSVTFGSLPTNGETIYLRLWTKLNGFSLFADYTYTAAAEATMISPTQGSAFTGSSQMFTWTAVTGATKYDVWVGSTGVGSNNLGGSGGTTSTSWTAGGLPTNGETIYVRLFTYYAGGSSHVDYSYLAAP